MSDGSKYRILESTEQEDLIFKVETLLHEGWNLAGGLSVVSYSYADMDKHGCEFQSHSTTYYQAMWKNNG